MSHLQVLQNAPQEHCLKGNRRCREIPAQIFSKVFLKLLKPPTSPCFIESMFPETSFEAVQFKINKSCFQHGRSLSLLPPLPRVLSPIVFHFCPLLIPVPLRFPPVICPFRSTLSLQQIHYITNFLDCQQQLKQKQVTPN